MLDRVAARAPVSSLSDRPEPIFPAVARGVVFEVDGKRLIDGIDLVIEAGPITVIMGPNGAGKSLLLRLLHGLIEPTEGEVRWAGRPVDERVRRRHAMVFQAPVLLRRSVAANLRFVLGLRAKRGEKTESRLERLLQQAGLADLAHRKARSLSGGEQQRLALARALAVRPDVLFLDEPTGSLEPASVAAVEDVVRAARRDGTKIVFVTHDVGQARRLADEIVFLHRGRIAEHGPAEAFFAGPSSRAARDYLAGRIVL